MGLFEKVYERLYSTGIVSAKKWTNLGNEKEGAKKKRTFHDYLDFDHIGRKLYVDIVKEYQPKSVLEIGSGGMHELRALSSLGVTKQNVKYNIMDVAKKFLEEGQKEFPEVEMKVGSVNKPIPNDLKGAYEWVYCRHLIEHQPYYKDPIKNMYDLASEVVMVNCFRWTFGNDIINKKPYFSNHYNVFELMNYVNNLFAHVDWFIVFKEGNTFSPRHRKEANPLTQRTSDHLFFVGYKDANSKRIDYSNIANREGISILDNPYSDIMERLR